jgi:CDGSH-type Zn-finger protein
MCLGVFSDYNLGSHCMHWAHHGDRIFWGVRAFIRSESLTRFQSIGLLLITLFMSCRLARPKHREHKMSDTPTISQKSPYGIEVVAGKSYFWCQCGLSSKQPFCDGSHKSTSFTPVKYQAEASGKIFFCGCKHSKNKPLCDGTHNSL